MKLLTYSTDKGSSSAGELKHIRKTLRSALRCVSGCGSFSSSVKTKSPFELDTDEDDASWLLGTEAGGMGCLPEDVLLAILACFPDKQKAVPLRAVCRTWRDLFNSSVNTITIHSNLQLLPNSPSRFPNLRHLCVSQTNATAAKAAVQLLGVPNCQQLTMLEISNIMMHEPPAELHLLTSLKCLSITSCRVKSVAAANLHKLPRLEVLDLSSNNLAELPSAIGSLGRSLRKLNVSDNALTYLPEGLGGLTNLQSLRAANNTLVELPDSLVDLVALTTLDLSLNRLKSVPDRLYELKQLKQLGLFAAFSHSVRNEGSSTVRVLGQMTLRMPQLHLVAEEVVLSLVRMRRKQLAMAAAVEAARNASPVEGEAGDAAAADNEEDEAGGGSGAAA